MIEISMSPADWGDKLVNEVIAEVANGVAQEALLEAQKNGAEVINLTLDERSVEIEAAIESRFRELGWTVTAHTANGFTLKKVSQ